MEQIFLELAVAIIIATLLAILLSLIKQPTIISYLIAGIVVGPFILDFVHESATLDALAEIGIAFLLFIVGLNLNMNTLREVGTVSLITGIGQIFLTTAFGFLICHFLFGFSVIVSLYVALAISFSSTIIIVKLLSDKKDLDTLYGKVAVGFLIVQDIVAIFALMAVSSLGGEGAPAQVIVATILKLAGVIFLLYVISQYVFPKLIHFLARTQELLFLFSISWAFLLSLLTAAAGFSIEIGALFAGITLASTNFHHEISGKIRSLRDFFIVLFFISLGAKLTFSSLGTAIFPALTLSAFILVGNPLIVMALMGFLGYKKRTGFLAGTAVAQISEFSLILVVLGAKVGHLSHDTISFITLVGILTLAGSTYFIIYNHQIYNFLRKHLGSFEKKLAFREEQYKFHDKATNYEVILFGYNRIGYSLLNSLHKMQKKYLIVDFDPDTIKALAKQGVNSIYGDASDAEFLDDLGLDRAQLVISTIPDMETNMIILEKAKNLNPKIGVIATAHQIDEALKLYESGADYIIMPHFLGGQHASMIIEQSGVDVENFVEHKIRHLNELQQRREQGHKHPAMHSHGR